MTDKELIGKALRLLAERMDSNDRLVLHGATPHTGLVQVDYFRYGKLLNQEFQLRKEFSEIVFQKYPEDIGQAIDQLLIEMNHLENQQR